MIMYTNTITSIRIEALSDLPKLKVFMENNNLKINKSDIARQMNVDCRTVSKYIDGFEKSKLRNKPSCMDSYYDTIKKLLSSQTEIFYYKRVLYQFLTDNYKLTVPEPTFYHYIKNTSKFNTYFIKGKVSNAASNSIIRFETKPGGNKHGLIGRNLCLLFFQIPERLLMLIYCVCCFRLHDS